MTAAAQSGVVEHVMGMPIVVDVRDHDVDDEALERVFDWLRWVDATFSTYRADSESAGSNRGELALADAHADVREVLERCEELRDETGGYFDARRRPAGSTRPGSSRAGRSTARPRSSTRRAAQLRDQRRRRHPPRGGASRAALAGRDPAPARPATASPPSSRRTTSRSPPRAPTTRGEHVLDPHTRRPPAGVALGHDHRPRPRDRDAYATAAFAMGGHGPPWSRGCATTRR